MANVDNANGFLPYSSGSGNGQPVPNEYTLLSGNAEIGLGSPIRSVAGGVDLAAAGGTLGLLGVAAEYKAASDNGTIKVWDDPDQLFVAQTDSGTGTATAASNGGLNIPFTGTGVTNRRSTAQLDQSEAATTSTDQFRLLYLSDEFQGKVKNAAGNFNRWVVKINFHQLGGGVGNDGV